MRQRKLPARISRRLGAALLAAATLWTVSVTAGSTDAAGAWQSLKREVPLALLRWQLGDPGQPDGLSAALRRLLDKFHLDSVDSGDLLLLLLLFFLFKEDADDELLIALGLLLVL